jgi:hypothetical protein
MLRLALAILVMIVTINTLLITQTLKAFWGAETFRAQIPTIHLEGSFRLFVRAHRRMKWRKWAASVSFRGGVHRAVGGFGGVWVETHSRQKSMNVRILRGRYLRLM